MEEGEGEYRRGRVWGRERESMGEGEGEGEYRGGRGRVW